MKTIAATIARATPAPPLALGVALALLSALEGAGDFSLWVFVVFVEEVWAGAPCDLEGSKCRNLHAVPREQPSG